MTEHAPLHTHTRIVLAAMGAALLVLVLGIAAVVTHDDRDDTRASTDRSVPTVPPTTSRAPSTSTSVSTSTSRPRATPPSASTTTTAPATGPTLRGIPGTTTPVRATVGSPEAAANGLIAAYRNDDRTLAARFASDAVVDVLFQQPYEQADDPGFQGCRREGTDFLCTYLQPTVRYDMTARGSDGGEFEIIAIDVRAT